MALGLTQAAPQLLEQAQTALAGLRDNFLQLVPTLAQGLREKTPEFISSGLDLLMGLSASLRENVGMLVDAALELVKSLAQGIADGIPGAFRILGALSLIVLAKFDTISGPFSIISGIPSAMPSWPLRAPIFFPGSRRSWRTWAP